MGSAFSRAPGKDRHDFVVAAQWLAKKKKKKTKKKKKKKYDVRLDSLRSDTLTGGQALGRGAELL